MANLKEVRERISSVINTQQITKAMKMVSAAKLRKAQGAIQQMRPYAIKLNDMLSNILSSLEGDATTTFGIQRNPENVCLVVVTSNRGLCGAFNTAICKEGAAAIEANYKKQYENGNLTILCIGKKGFDFFRRRYPTAKIVDTYVNLFDNLAFDNTSKVAEALMSAFVSGTYDKIDIAYSRFRNAAIQIPQVEAFLPVPKMEKTESKSKSDYIFEPSKQELLENLIPGILKIQFQKTLLDTNASEHGARMTAMDNATNNADDILRALRISYNKARQDVITSQLMEIISGAAALES